MTAKKSFIQNFSQPSYMTGTGGGLPYQTEDTTTDPVFKVTSKKPYKGEIVTRSTVWDYFRTSLLLPNPSEILQALGRGIEEMDQLLVDARVKAAYNNRRSGTLSLKWSIDQNDSPVRMFKLVQKVLDKLPIYDIMSEMLMAPMMGYAVTEIVWTYQDGWWLPEALSGKPARWFGFGEDNSLRYKTKMNQVSGEPLPPRHFLLTRYHPTYGDPACSREALYNAVYWPKKFRAMVLEYAIRFSEKYGTPWLDITMEAGLQEDRLNEILDVLQRTFQDGLIAHPDNTKITPLDMSDTKSVENYGILLDILNREIDMAILGNNLTTEIKGGSYAAASAHMSVREDIIREDSRMLETSFNELIEWIAFYNFGISENLPKFKLYKAEPPTLERAQIDILLSKLGVKFSKSYLSRSYGLSSDEFELGPVVPQLTTAMAGNVAGSTEEVQAQPEDTTTDLGIATVKTIEEISATGTEPTANPSTEEAFVRGQGRGSGY